MKKLVLTFLILMFSATQTPANMTWDVARGRSVIGFKVKHLVFMDVKGRFKEFEGKVITQDENLENAQMIVKIDASSIYTGIDDRDKHLIGKDFFFTEKFPDIVFKSKSVVKINDEKGCYKILGDLTMRGITKPIELFAECHSFKKLPNGKTRIDLTATGSLNRFDYQLEWNEYLEKGRAVVGELVSLNLKIALLN